MDKTVEKVLKIESSSTTGEGSSRKRARDNSSDSVESVAQVVREDWKKIRRVDVDELEKKAAAMSDKLNRLEHMMENLEERDKIRKIDFSSLSMKTEASTEKL